MSLMPHSNNYLKPYKTRSISSSLLNSVCFFDFVKYIRLELQFCPFSYYVILVTIETPPVNKASISFLYLQAYTYDSPKKEKRHARKWRSKHYSKDNKTTLQVLFLSIFIHTRLKENSKLKHVKYVYIEIFVKLFRNSGANLLVCVVLLLFLWEVSGYMLLWYHRVILIVPLHINGKKCPTIIGLHLGLLVSSIVMAVMFADLSVCGKTWFLQL